MIDFPPLPPFQPNAPDAAGVTSWAHIGDLHMALAQKQNHLDLLAIVDELNRAFAASLSFVFIPGDVADQGSVAQYEIVREALDKLRIPWCSIVGDHDVHEKSFANFLRFMAHQTHYRFAIGDVQFFALNAFDVPDPGSFILLSSQLEWLEAGLKAMTPDETAVLLLHCYPTDLKQGGGELRALIDQYPVRLVEMGHTHYNEVANDGRTLYAATRSTGQIEEGPVGFSVTSLDGAVLSWKFFALGTWPAVVITSPADERFFTERNADALAVKGHPLLRAKIWSDAEIREVRATVGEATVLLAQVEGSNVWQAELPGAALADGVYEVTVEATDAQGRCANDKIRMVCGEAAYKQPERNERDQDNPLAAWPGRGLLGTQLGPNKFGTKW